MNKKTIIWLIVVLGVAVGLILISDKPNSSSFSSPHSSVSNSNTERVVEDAGGDDSSISTTPGSFEAYSPEKLARADEGDVVLFFHASWCPSCRVLNKDIENNLSNIPSDLSILKLDYDTETELKKKYGVTYQHTLVQVDSSGEMIQKWSGGSNLHSIISKL